VRVRCHGIALTPCKCDAHRRPAHANTLGPANAEPFAYPHVDANTHADAFADPGADAHTNPCTHTHASAHIYANPASGVHTHAPPCRHANPRPCAEPQLVQPGIGHAPAKAGRPASRP